MTDKERLMKMLNKGWKKVPDDLYAVARKTSFTGEIDWNETSKSAKLGDASVNDVVEAIESFNIAESFDYVDGEFGKLNSSTDAIFNLRVTDDSRHKTNTFNLNQEELKKLKIY